MRRPITLAACALAAAALPGCGNRQAAAPKPLPPVRLAVTSPQDRAVVLDSVVQIRGTVSPGRAQVLVLGSPAAVSGGEFTAEVPLAEGVNVIDVTASAGGSAPALTALRVTREVRVTIPDLIGQDSDGAEAKLRALGLKVDEARGGSIFDALLPGGRSVCDTDPRGGDEVRRGTTVTVIVAKRC